MTLSIDRLFPGITLPLKLSSIAGTDLAYGRDTVNDLLRTVILTEEDTIPLHDGFGTPVVDAVFDMNDDALAFVLRSKFEEKVRRFLGDILSVAAVSLTREENTVYGKIIYMVTQTGQVGELTVPLSQGGVLS